jgi:hypothetical protein
MRTEDDLRAALATLEARAPEADTVATAIRGRDGQRRRTVPGLAGRLRRAGSVIGQGPGHQGKRGRRRVAGLTTASAVAAAVALLVAVVSTGGEDKPPVISGGPPPGAYRLPVGTAGIPGGAAQPARQVLLAAAVQAAQATPTAGRYWKTTSVDGNFRLVGPDDDPYVILERVRDEGWIKTPSGAGEEFVQSLGVQLGSAADRPAWRRAGSPTSWPFGLTDGLAEPGGLAGGESPQGPLPDTPGKLHNVFGGTGSSGGAFLFGTHGMSRQQLLALPADPVRLRGLLLVGGRWRDWSDGSAVSYLFEAVPQALRLPVTDAVRSALYQVLAGLPGVQSLGLVRDAAGQQGNAIAVTARHRQCGDPLDLDSNLHGGTDSPQLWPTCTVQQRLIISASTGQPLAMELRYKNLPDGQTWPGPGGLFSFEIFGSARWTDAGWPKIGS